MILTYVRFSHIWSAAFLTASAFGATSSAAVAGATAYRSHCAACHGGELAGGSGPPLSGPAFAEKWSGKSAVLQEAIASRMPLDAPGSLSPQEYTVITAYVLEHSHLEGSSVAEAPRHAAQSHPGNIISDLPSEPSAFDTAIASSPNDAELMDAASDDWLRYNRDYRGQRFSPLTQIAPANVARLAPRCIFQTGEVGSFQSSPIVYAGRMFITTPHNTYALDASDCHRFWLHTYTPTGPEPLPSNRGVALYEGMAIRGTTDGHLIALDSMRGTLLWDVQVCDSRTACFISAAPVVFEDKLFIGEAGADFGAVGKVHAFDARTGRHLWTTNVIPQGNEPGAKTWEQGAPRGGGSMWTSITVDPVARLLYVSVGNPDSDFDGRYRPGANLYTNSVMVLDIDAGKLQWYVQQNPHDVRDWDTAAAPVIYDQDGRQFMAVGSKDARLYLYDRNSHALLARKNLARRLNDTILPIPGKALRMCPGALGGVEWNGPAYSPENRMIYVNSVDWCMTLTVQKSKAEGSNPYGGIPVFDPPDQAKGSLRAFDAATGAEIWVYDASAPMLAGITPTASGLLLTGSADGSFLIFDSKSGRQLYRFNTGGAVAGGISTYMVGDRQYIAVPSGNSSKSLFRGSGAATMIVFGLNE
jgi:alcohol dehydrogenase (cytochrome c)